MFSVHSLSCEFSWGNFFKLATDINSVVRMNWLEFVGQRSSQDTLLAGTPKFHTIIIIRFVSQKSDTFSNIITVWVLRSGWGQGYTRFPVVLKLKPKQKTEQLSATWQPWRERQLGSAILHPKLSSSLKHDAFILQDFICCAESEILFWTLFCGSSLAQGWSARWRSWSWWRRLSTSPTTLCGATSAATWECYPRCCRTPTSTRRSRSSSGTCSPPSAWSSAGTANQEKVRRSWTERNCQIFLLRPK